MRNRALMLLLSLPPAGMFFFSEPSPAPGSPDGALFIEAARETGLQFEHFIGATGEYYMPEIMGSGVALFDYDGDGDLDVYLVQGTRLDEGEPTFPWPEGQARGNRLFRNELTETGELRFTDVTEEAGVGDDGYGMGVAVGDFTNNGYPDLYVTNFGPNVLYRNNGDGTFTNVTAQAGVDDPRWSTSATFFDMDGNGRLDLYVANYLNFTVRGNRPCFAPTGERDYCSPAVYRPVSDRLFRNLGNGRFEDVTETSGIGSELGPGLGVIAADLDDSGRLDLYLANDGTANFLWQNRGDGTFKEIALLAGVAFSGDGLPQAGMGVTVGDFDNSGREHVLVTNLTREGSVLYLNDGRGNFHDATRELGLLGPSFLSTGFGVHWFDYDNDGRLDLFAVNGAVTIIPELRGTPYPFQQLNQLFRNLSGSRGFREVTAEAGPALSLLEVSRGAAFGDIDNDGDVDVVVSNNNGPVRLLLNQAGNRSNWLLVGLEGAGDNRQGLGARVSVELPDGSRLWRRAHTDGSYLSAGDHRVHFGLGDAGEVTAVEVYWPSGAAERWTDIEGNRQITLRQGTGEPLGRD